MSNNSTAPMTNPQQSMNEELKKEASENKEM